MLGFPDKPIEKNIENQFKTTTYVDVMSDFISTCDTPMTIAIQGDWGTGKTSMMNMIWESLKQKGDEYNLVWFNTWQYSQFNLGDQVPNLLLNKLINEISPNEKTKSELKSTFIKGMKFVSKMGVSYATQGNVNLEFDESTIDEIENLINLKKKFEESVKNCLRFKGKNSRMVVFIDDLDRLQPQKAVEILETMKIFLDCEKCVFVLAVDYDVVARGVKAKYGETLSDEKGKSFFDKIIQLPFKMPVAKYDIDNYITKLMSVIYNTKYNSKDVENYREIIEHSIGKNPRSIKRTVNSFTIINKVAEKENKLAFDDINVLDAQRKVLFVLLCMQLSLEDLYDYVLSQSTEDTSESFIKDLDIKAVFTDEADENTDIYKNNAEMLDIFKKWSTNLLKASANTKYNDALADILSLSAITSNDTKERRIVGQRDYSKIYFDGKEYPKAKLPEAVVKKYIENHGEAVVTLAELKAKFEWGRVKRGVIRFVEEVEKEKVPGKKRRYTSNPIQIADGRIFVWSDWGPSKGFQEYMDTILKNICQTGWTR